jgi:hypothetical protein
MLNNMNKIIELVEKVDNGDGTRSLIAECNGYENNVRVAQFSRSPFTYPDTMTDQDIIDYLWANEYIIYA